MILKNHPIVIYLDRNGFILYQDSLASLFQFSFLPDVVRDLEVINKEKLISFINSFIQTTKIIQSSLVVVLSDSVIFQKTLVAGSQAAQAVSQTDNNTGELQEKEIQNFLENIPFEDILAKQVKTTLGIMLVAVNKELVETITDPFKKYGCFIAAIVPSFIYGETVNFASTGLTYDTAQAVLQKGELLKQGNLLTGQEAINPPQSLEDNKEQEKEKPKNIRQYVLVGIFIVLLIILGIAYFTLGRAPLTPKKIQSQPPVEPINAISPTPTISIEPTNILKESSPSATVDPKSIQIKIIEKAENKNLENALRQGLLQVGFQDIKSEISANAIPAKSSVLFSQSIPNILRQIAISEIKKVLPDVLVQESQDAELTITVIIGNI